jgi:hypothetical protein
MWNESTGRILLLPATSPIIYSLPVSNWMIQENFKDFKIIPYPNQGRHSGEVESREV